MSLWGGPNIVDIWSSAVGDAVSWRLSAPAIAPCHSRSRWQEWASAARRDIAALAAAIRVVAEPLIAQAEYSEDEPVRVGLPFGWQCSNKMVQGSSVGLALFSANGCRSRTARSSGTPLR